MKIVRTILLLLVMIAIVGYMVVAFLLPDREKDSSVCNNIELSFIDNVGEGYISLKEVKAQLLKSPLNPIGKKMDQIQIIPIERQLEKHPLIERVDCYKTPSNKIGVEVLVRRPLFRIMGARGENYFIDRNGKVMPYTPKFVGLLPIATGYISKEYAQQYLYPFVLFLEKNSFWSNQVEQINVDSKQNVELVCRVGDHMVEMGKMEDYEQKLARVKKFYEKALNKIGWNKYSRINVEFSNQIICTKR